MDKLLTRVWSHFSELVGCTVTIKLSLLTCLFCCQQRCIVPVAPTLMATVNKDMYMLANYLFVQLVIKTPFPDSLVQLACWKTAQFCTATATRHLALTAKTVNFFWRGCRHLCWIGTAQWKYCRHITLSCELQSKCEPKQCQLHSLGSLSSNNSYSRKNLLENKPLSKCVPFVIIPSHLHFILMTY